MILDDFTSKYPYTDFHTMNLDWLLAQMLQLRTDMKDFVNLNTIKYADPIQWNITTQYQGNTVVVEPISGDAYLSTKPVPSGVAITDTDYWTVIGSFGSIFTNIKASISAADEGPSAVASANRAVDDLVWLSDKLYVVTAPIATGESYVPGTNCEAITVEMLLKKESQERADADAVISSSILAIGGQLADEIVTREDADNVIHGSILTLAGQIGDLTDSRKVCSPEMFGAAGDGTTDDSAAFQSAVDSGMIISIEGKYLIHDISITHDIVIIGNGGEIRATPFDTSVPFDNVLTVRNCNLYIDGVKFTGKKYSGMNITTRNSYIDIEGGNNTTIINCLFEGFGYRYANTDAAAWNFFAVIVKCVDCKDFVFENNTINNCGGDEMFVITPHTATRTSIRFNNNKITTTVGASINLFANDVQINGNDTSGFVYAGSIFNVTGDKVTFEDNRFVDCTVGSVFDAIEGCEFHAEYCYIKNNVFLGTADIFATADSGHMVIEDNYVECKALALQELTAMLSDHMPPDLQNDRKRTHSVFRCVNNTIKIAGTMTQKAIVRCLGINVHATSIYDKITLGRHVEVDVSKNNFIFDSTATGGSYLIYIDSTADKVLCNDNYFENPNIDAMAGTGKFAMILDNRDTAGKCGNVSFERNVFMALINTITNILPIGCIESGSAMVNLIVNSNFLSGRNLAIPAVCDNKIIYTINNT